MPKEGQNREHLQGSTSPSTCEFVLAQLPEQLFWPAAKITPDFESDRSPSRFGGTPDLPPDFTWPEHAGTPLSLLFHLDLADLKGVSHGLPLPEVGALLFFYDAVNQPWGLEPGEIGASKVVFLPAGASGLPRPAPAGAPVFPRVAAQIDPTVSAPNAWSPWLDELALSADKRFELSEALEPYANYDAQVGGHPTVVQQPMEIDCELLTRGFALTTPDIHRSAVADQAKPHQRDWRLLLQLGSDDALGMEWGNLGTLYFWAKVDAIEARDFSQVVAILQCT